ncbi:serine hydrolase domain-containing protein [Streptomyces sp. NPDC093252]|uniref:serine hydrolase domain-containing protein n=1 Tax=Streptomyces sp. NPDC093252 TaxID=3154980 RepID=UPI0034332BAF
MASVTNASSELQQRVQAVVDDLVDWGVERGIQVAVHREGRLVAEAWAGVADPEHKLDVNGDTLFYATSTGKAATATLVHVLAERGAFGYDTRIAELWPEFGAEGKGEITVGHALTHRAGVPGLPVDTTPEDLGDWEKMCAALAAARPWWAPGTEMGYHAQSFGFLLGEVVRRATGVPVSAALRQYVTEPLGIADQVYFGVPGEALGRVARLEDGPMPEMPEGVDMSEVDMGGMEDLSFFRVVDGYTAAPLAALPDAAFGNRPDVLGADIPAGATMTARGMSRLLAALMDDVDGVRLIGPERLRQVSAVAAQGVDQVIGFPVTRGLGYDLGYSWPMAAGPTSVFGAAGSGGTAAYADTATRTSFAVVKNIHSPGDYSTAQRIAEVIDEG